MPTHHQLKLVANTGRLEADSWLPSIQLRLRNSPRVSAVREIPESLGDSRYIMNPKMLVSHAESRQLLSAHFGFPIFSWLQPTPLRHQFQLVDNTPPQLHPSRLQPGFAVWLLAEKSLGDSMTIKEAGGSSTRVRVGMLVCFYGTPVESQRRSTPRVMGINDGETVIHGRFSRRAATTED